MTSWTLVYGSWVACGKQSASAEVGKPFFLVTGEEGFFSAGVIVIVLWIGESKTKK